jgi:predicted phosphoribosyltransferase
MKVFKDRTEAGRELAEALSDFAGREDVIVLGLPRGGVPVAFEVAKSLKAPLDIFLVRKLGVPGQEELAFGAISTGGVRVFNQAILNSLMLPQETIEQIVSREREELERRERAYRGDRPLPQIEGNVAILVDDGLATGASMRAALSALRGQNPSSIVAAVPTAPPGVCEELGNEVDEVVCIITPEPFGGVGAWYENFAQTTDQEVRDLLAEAECLIEKR